MQSHHVAPLKGYLVSVMLVELCKRWSRHGFSALLALLVGQFDRRYLAASAHDHACMGLASMEALCCSMECFPGFSLHRRLMERRQSISATDRVALAMSSSSLRFIPISVGGFHGEIWRVY